MKKLLYTVMGLAISATMIFTGCGNKQAPKTASTENNDIKIMFAGSSTLAPVISKAADNFTQKYKTWNKVDSKLGEKNIQIAVSSSSSGAGIKAAMEKTSNFGLIAKNMSKEEKEKMPKYKEYKIAMDALTISVNSENPVLKIKKSLTKDEIQKIFSGEIKTWKELDATLPANKIVVVVRDAGGGAGEVFEKSMMGDKKVSKEAIQSPSMGALGQKIVENKDAIGYASVGIVDQNKGKITSLDVDGISPNAENILSGKYKIARPLVIIKDGDLSPEETAFMNYITSEEGLKIVSELGFVPVKSVK